MNRYYVSTDGDNAGDQVGRAVLDDNAAELNRVSSVIDSGNEHIAQWAVDHGGSVISKGGDQTVFQMDGVEDEEEFLDHLESLRAEYEQLTGFTVSMGVGLSLSQSGKSLVAAKLLGKDLLVRYNPSEVDDIIVSAHKHAESGEGTSEENKQDDAYISHLMGDSESEEHDEEADRHVDSEDNYEMNIDEVAAEDHHDQEQGLDVSGEEVSEDQGNPEEASHEEQFGEEQELLDEATAPESSDQEATGIAYEEPMDESDSEDHTDADLPKASEADESPESIVDAIAAQGKGDFNEEEEIEIKDANVKKEDPQAAEPTDAEVAGSMEQDEQDQELKAKVAEVLSGFKAQKEALLAMKDQAPELYGSTLGMLEMMIAMSKRLFPAQDSTAPASPEAPEAQREAAPPAEVPQDPKM